MTHLKLQTLQKGDHPPAHRLNVNVLLSNIMHLFVIFTVLDVSFAVNSCLNRSFFLHLYLQFYYISVAVNWYMVRGTEYVIPTILGAPSSPASYQVRY